MGRPCHVFEQILVISGKGSYFQADRGKKFCYSGKKATSARTGKALSM
jgi:hypothetical protein